MSSGHPPPSSVHPLVLARLKRFPLTYKLYVCFSVDMKMSIPPRERMERTARAVRYLKKRLMSHASYDPFGGR